MAILKWTQASARRLALHCAGQAATERLVEIFIGRLRDECHSIDHSNSSIQKDLRPSGHCVEREKYPLMQVRAREAANGSAFY